MGLLEKLKKIIKGEKNRELDTMPVEETVSKVIDNKTTFNLIKQLPLTNQEKEERVASLTLRERDIFLLLIEGFSLKEAAKQSGIKYSTANTHMTAIYRKLNVNTRAELIINYRNIRR